MAADGGTRRKRAGKPEGKDESRETDRVVLKRQMVLVVPEGITDDKIKEVQMILREKELLEKVAAVGLDPAEAGAITAAWVELGTAAGSKDRAIRHFAGEAGTPDAKPGTYKAPSASAMRGGARYKLPVQRVDREPLD